MIEEALGEFVEAVVSFTRFQKIAQDHGVHHFAGECEASLGEYNPVVFDVLANECAIRVFEYGPQFFEDKAFV